MSKHSVIVISSPSPVIPSGARNLVVWLRAGSARNLFTTDS